MTIHEKNIRAKWLEFKNKQNKTKDKKIDMLQVQNMLKAMFSER